MKKYKIRTLTPKEIGRFMDVSDKNIDIMINSGLSDTQLMRMFGNSIVVSCMSDMFKNLFVRTCKRKDETLW